MQLTYLQTTWCVFVDGAGRFRGGAVSGRGGFGAGRFRGGAVSGRGGFRGGAGRGDSTQSSKGL